MPESLSREEYQRRTGWDCTRQQAAVRSILVNNGIACADGLAATIDAVYRPALETLEAERNEALAERDEAVSLLRRITEDAYPEPGNSDQSLVLTDLIDEAVLLVSRYANHRREVT